MPTQDLTGIVSVNLVISPSSVANSGFNIGLIMGKSTIITPATRTAVYNSTDDMLAGGWAGTEPEFVAAQKYFGQSVKPPKIVIGRWDGTGAETALQAITLCRSSNTDWYAAMICGAVKADIVAVAPYIETATPLSFFFYTTADADNLTGAGSSVMGTLKLAKYRKTIGQYSTTVDAIAAIMGYAMGANTGLANSAYTLAYKQEVGVPAESLSTAQVNFVLGLNGNLYTNYGAKFDLFVQGVVADGTSFDEVLNLDVFKSNIQNAIMNALVGSPKIPQSEDGLGQLLVAITDPCNDARNRGILAPGVWKKTSILGLKTGDTLSTGYMILADQLATQSQVDRDARKSPPIYIAAKLAGAMEHVVIGVIVNR